MLIRLMTLATVLMLLACLAIGATLALAKSAHADEVTLAVDPAQVQNDPSSIKDAPLLQGDTAVAAGPYQPNLAAADQLDQYDFDNLPVATDRDDDPSSYAALVSC